MNPDEIEEVRRILDAICDHKSEYKYDDREIWYSYPKNWCRTDAPSYRVIVVLEPDMSGFRLVYQHGQSLHDNGYTLMEALAEIGFVLDKLMKPISDGTVK